MMQALLTPLDPARFRQTPWKNGGGVTIDIADAYRPGVAPGSWQGMIWRLGRTAIVTPGPFSDLSGFERLQLVIVGRGLVLETPDGEIDLRQPFVPVRYDGGTPITSRLENGPVEVVNLIADQTLCAIDLRPLGGGDTARLEPGTHVLYGPGAAAAGRIGDRDWALAAGRALLIDATAAVDLTVARGAPLLASITPR